MKYVLLVYGPMAENEAERAAGMAEMADWYGRLGPALVDPGSPFTGAVKTVSQNGVKDGAIGSQATGFNIVEAASLSAATEIAKGCPLLKAGRQIVVYEAFSAM
ncbi:MAG: hypothetical protein E6I86_02500 [Chloroflexi bacterium]|nr:MAG: hypothetical protein E6I86_02500 [Chloroflexota bacterium]